MTSLLIFGGIILTIGSIAGLMTWRETKALGKPKYGFDFDPILVARKRLPQLEWPHAWETYVNEDNLLVVAKVDLRTDSRIVTKIGMPPTSSPKFWRSIVDDHLKRFAQPAPEARDYKLEMGA